MVSCSILQRDVYEERVHRPSGGLRRCMGQTARGLNMEIIVLLEWVHRGQLLRVEIQIERASDVTMEVCQSK